MNSSRLQFLLAYILLHRQAPVSRQTLSAVFWPDTSDAQSRTNLRNLLYQLRHAVPTIEQFLQMDKTSVEWIKGSSYILDVEIFENSLAMTTGSVVNREALEAAIEIYSGDLLPDCYDDWIIPIRQRLQAIYLKSLEAVAVMAEQSREYPSALGYIRRLLAVDPLHTGGNLQFVRLLALNDERAAALKAYKVYKRQLMVELAIEPEPEIRTLYERLLKGEETRGVLIPQSIGALVGRQLEWHKLLACWNSAVEGRAQIVFVQGEAGIGKTRLVEELVTWAQRQGIQTASAFCFAAEGNLSLNPLVNWLRSLSLSKLEKTWLVEVGRLLPEIFESMPELPAPEPMREAWQRQRFFEGLARAVLARQELILILEDCHWADQDTLEWLHFLLRFAPQSRLLVVATIRNGEAGEDHPLQKLRQALRAGGKSLDLDVHPLNEAEAQKLVFLMAQSSAATRLNRETALRICREAEGNPLFIIEMTRLGLTEAGPGDAGLSESEKIQVVLEQRLGHLNPKSSNTMALAATIGRSFSLDVLLKASSESDEVVINAIDDMLYRKVIREISATEYDFTHDLVRKAAFGRLSTAHRRLLHRRVAEAFLLLDGTLTSGLMRSAEIASHFEQAGLFVQAVKNYQQAAEAAARLFANIEAEKHLQRSVELVEQMGINASTGIPAAELAGLLERLGDMLVLNGKYPQAITTYERIVNILQDPIEQKSMAKIWCSQIYRKISEVWLPLYHHDQAHTALDMAEKLMQFAAEKGGQEERQEWIQVQLARIQLYYFDNHPAEMKVMIEKLRPLIASAGQLDQQYNLIKMESYMRVRQERFRLSDESIEVSRRRLGLANQLNDPAELALAQFQHGFVLLWHDEQTAAQDWLQKGFDGLTRVGNTIWRIRALSYLSVVRRKLDQLDGLQALTQKLVEEAKAIGEHTYYGIGLANLGWLAWRSGDSVHAEQLCLQARAVWAKFGGCSFHSLGDWVLLAISLQAQDLSGAKQAAEYLLDPDPALQPLRQPAADLLGQALHACQAGEAGAAFALFNQALAEARATCEL